VSAEIELKLAIAPRADAATVAALKRHPAVAAVRRGRWRRAQVTSTYYDTPDWRLATAGIALRVRRYGKRWLQTVKGPALAEGGAGLHARPELEWPLATPELDTVRLAATPWRQLFGALIAEDALRPRFVTAFERLAIRLAFDDATAAELCIDRGEITLPPVAATARRTRARRAAIAEVELELKAGDPGRLYDLALALTRDLPLSVAVASKAARGVALAQGNATDWSEPLRADTVAIDADAPADVALARIARACLEQIAANAPGLVADTDPEWVHQMRIGTRRLRSCLALAAPYLPAATLEPLIAEIRWLAQALGHSRDWDVFAVETLPPFAAQFAADPVIGSGVPRLRARTARRRGGARAAARAAVRSPRFQQLVLGIGAMCNARRVGNLDPGATTELPPGITEFARKLLERRHRRLAKRGAALADGTPEERHAVRIAAKKLRYAAEFFAPLFPRKHARAYAKSLAALQDVLGRANDAATAARLVAELREDAHEPAVAALAGWIGAQGAAILPLSGAAWTGFTEARRFWTGD
jgi:inorganic triphosphatase YgiF